MPNLSEQLSSELEAQLIESNPEYSKSPERRLFKAIEVLHAQNKTKLLREEMKYCEYASKYIASAFSESIASEKSGIRFQKAEKYKELLPIADELIRLWRIRNRFNGHEKDMEEYLYATETPHKDLYFGFDTSPKGEVFITRLWFQTRELQKEDSGTGKESSYLPDSLA